MSAVQHDLTPNELSELVGLFKQRPTQRWRWIRCGQNERILNPQITIADGQITEVTAEGDYSSAVIVRCAFEALRRRQKRRQAAAKEAAQTRKARREAEVYRVAHAYLKGGVLTSAARCRICGKQVTDQASRQRGIGSECWQAVLDAIQQIQAQGRAPLFPDPPAKTVTLSREAIRRALVDLGHEAKPEDHEALMSLFAQRFGGVVDRHTLYAIACEVIDHAFEHAWVTRFSAPYLGLMLMTERGEHYCQELETWLRNNNPLNDEEAGL